MPLDRISVARTIRILESHYRALCKLCTKLRDGEYDDLAMLLSTEDTEALREAIDWLDKSGMQPTARRLERHEKNFLLQRTDDMFCELARHEGDDYAGWLRSNVGPFPDPADDDAEHEELRGVRMTALLGYAIQYSRFLKELLHQLRESISADLQAQSSDPGSDATEPESPANVCADGPRVESIPQDIEEDSHEQNAGDPSQKPALTRSGRRTLLAMATLDPAHLATVDEILDAMPGKDGLGQKTTRKSIAQLIELGLAERPDGDRLGARLTRQGRKLSSRLAD